MVGISENKTNDLRHSNTSSDILIPKRKDN